MLPSLVELHLSECGLDRMPPLETVNFTSLAVLDLSWNNFYSSIPRWIFSLGSLVSLDLGLYEFHGPILDGLWNLTSLKVLDVSYNNLNSTLPNSLFSLNMANLYLGSNGFEGPIPSGLRNMTNLRELDLSQNFDMNSSIPNWLYSFRYLEVLDLSGIKLQGIVSSSIENLTSLVFLDLSYTGLKGRVPRAMGKLCKLRMLAMQGNRIEQDISEVFNNLAGCISSALESLSLDECQLSGHLTDQLEQFKSLYVLNLGGNSISGPIPVSLGRFSSLTTLNLAGNQLEGVVSEVHFANLTSLEYFRASGNQLALNVSPNWVPPFQLVELDLTSWQLGPQFPMWLHSQKGLNVMDLSCTRISDSIPHWFWNLSSNLVYLNLSHNGIRGKISNILKLDVPYSIIHLGSNQFSGPLPRLSSNVTVLDLSNNTFSGDISHFLCDRKDDPNQLKILHLGENHLSGEIPDCWKNWPALEVIKLGNNHLSGIIPSSLGYLRSLRSLHLRSNHLSGEVPQSLENCTELITIDLGWNQFVGSIPTWLGTSLSNLKLLSLRSNKFYGEIPSQLCHLSSLQILELANNSFSGTIPRCFKNLTALAVTQDSSYHILYLVYGGEFLENAFVVTKGRQVQYDTILRLVRSMDLSDNNISGEIPEELTSLLGLFSLNLSGNHLTGVIPRDIGMMKLLESLDLSRNQLSGEIPPSMSDLTFLSYLNVSNNNLAGRIPTSTQLQSLDASGFTGNKLCGPPLPNNCIPDGAPLDGRKGGDEEGVETEVDWFYVTAAFGFVVGFWGIVGPLAFKKSWRYVYFQFLDEMWSKICNCLS